MFSEAIFDILVILDCSHLIIDAAIRSRDPHDGLYGRIELLAATSNTAKTGQPEGGSFTNAVTTTMRDMITKYGSIDIAELHALLVQQASNSYTVPIYVPLREGASEQTLVLERLLGEQGQRVTNSKRTHDLPPFSWRVLVKAELPLIRRKGVIQKRYIVTTPGRRNHRLYK
jgi:hypothetical protein